jgi:competence protein ComEC
MPHDPQWTRRNPRCRTPHPRKARNSRSTKRGTSCSADRCSAGAKELEGIIHIGPERAGQIVQLRKEKPFRNVDELVRVKGIAAVRLADIKKEGLACVR